jgi:hypothetical protein
MTTMTADDDDDDDKHEILRLGDCDNVAEVEFDDNVVEVEFDQWVEHHLKMTVKGKVCD